MFPPYYDIILHFIYFFCIFIGVGLGLIFLPNFVIVQQYFEKNRALASGLSLMGFSIGQIIAAPPFQYLITTYTWRGFMLIYGALSLNVFAVGQLLRSPPSVHYDTGKNPEKEHYATISKSDTIVHYESSTESAHIIRNKETDPVLEITSHSGSTEIISKETDPILEITSHNNKNKENQSNYQSVECGKPSHKIENHRKQSIYEDIKDFSLLKNPSFQLFGWGTFCFNTAVLIFNMHLPSRAFYYGISSKMVSFLPLALSVGAVTARLLTSLIANRPCCNRSLVYSLGMLLYGICIILASPGTDFISMVCFSFVAGFFQSKYFLSFLIFPFYICLTITLFCK